MKIKSKQVYSERLELIPGLTAKTYVLAKGRPGGVIEIVMISIRATGANKIKNIQRVYTVRGKESWLDTRSDIQSLQCKTFVDPLYLADGHETGLRFIGETFDATCQIFVHYLWHVDKD